MIKKQILILNLIVLLLLFIRYNVLYASVTVEGNAYLNNQTNHNNIKVNFESTTSSNIKDSTYTNNSGYYSIDVATGSYNVTYSKVGYYSKTIFEVIDSSEVIPNITIYSYLRVPHDFTTIQEAINNCYKGDTVIVYPDFDSEGNPDGYEENIYYNGTGITVASLFYITHDSSYISQTIIDGIYNESVVTFEDGEDSTSILSGFTLINGNGQVSEYSGGVTCKNNSNPSLENLIIMNTFQGSGINCYNSSPSLNNVTIKNNSDDSAFGIYCDENSSPNIYNSTIINNLGIGIYCADSSNPYLDSVKIMDNSGSGINCDNSSPNLENVTIINNLDGGIYCADSSNPYLDSVKIMENSGSGISCDDSSPTLENVKIMENSGSGISCDNSSPNLENVTIKNNSAVNGGGISLYSGSAPELYNVSITNNYASEKGGGIYLDSHPGKPTVSPNLANVTISNNIAKEKGGGIYGEGDIKPEFSESNRCNIYSNNSGIDWCNGADIFISDENYLYSPVYLDTFTVLNPTDYYLQTETGWHCDILHSVKDELINSDLYVSVNGNNSNTGTSPDDPLKTIRHALSMIYADYENINTVHLSPGVYSNSTNGEIFPIHWIDRVNLSGSGQDTTILNANNSSLVMDFYFTENVLVEDITVTGGNGSFGGGVYCKNTSIDIVDVKLTNNSSSYGGGICLIKEIPLIHAKTNLKNVEITNNSALAGGGIFCDQPTGLYSPNLENVTVAYNSSDYWGCGITCYNAPISMTNSIVSNNIGSYGIWFIYFGSTEPSITYSDFYNNGNGNFHNCSPGTGCIEENPLFVDPANVNYNLTSNSPCINAGDPNSQLDPDGTVKDMGAYYYDQRIHPDNPVHNITQETDHPYIQDGINSSVDGDTIIVDTSKYVENINFNGKNIILGSLFLTTQDTSYISQTIIDGHETGSTVKFTNGEDTTTILCGFTITNGDADKGGGIYCDNSSPHLDNLIIKNNNATHGGGIRISGNSTPILENLKIIGNNASNSGGGFYWSCGTDHIDNITIKGNSAWSGGGIYFNGSSSILDNVVIKNNNSENGGGIYCTNNSSPVIKNVSIIDNNADSDGGGIWCTSNSSISLKNSILANNTGNYGIYMDYDNNPSITYSDIYNNENGNFYNCSSGTGCIEEDPLFVNPTNGNYNLASNSPCIDAGAPSTTVPESGGWRVDIGANEFIGTRILREVNGTGEILLGGQVKSKIEVNTLGSLSEIDFNVYPGEVYPDASNSISRWYRITPKGDIENYDIILSYLDCELNGEEESKLNLWKWDGISWTGPIEPDIINTDENWMRVNNLTSFSDFVISDSEDDSSLPIGLSKFSAVVTNGKVILRWITESENNNRGFNIYRSRFKNDHYIKINNNIIEGAGNSSTNHKYEYIDDNIVNGIMYWYKLEDVDFEGNTKIHGPIAPEQIEDNIPEDFRLYANYPNPFNPITNINYDLPKESNVKIAVYNVKGKIVNTLVQANQDPGRYMIKWNGTNKNGKQVPSGVYLLKIITDKYTKTNKMVLVR